MSGGANLGNEVQRPHTTLSLLLKQSQQQQQHDQPPPNPPHEQPQQQNQQFQPQSQQIYPQNQQIYPQTQPTQPQTQPARSQELTEHSAATETALPIDHKGTLTAPTRTDGATHETGTMKQPSESNLGSTATNHEERGPQNHDTTNNNSSQNKTTTDGARLDTLNAAAMDDEALSQEIKKLEQQLKSAEQANGEEPPSKANAIPATASAPNEAHATEQDIRALKQHVPSMSTEQIQEEIQRLHRELTGGAQIFCTCRKPESNLPMIACDICDEWFHLGCIGLTPNDANCIDKYVCASCQKKRHNKIRTTYKTGAALEEAFRKELDVMDENTIRMEIQRIEAELHSSETAAAAAAGSRVILPFWVDLDIQDDEAGEGVHDPALVHAVRAVMQQLNLSQHDVVTACGISGGQAVLSSWLNAKKISRVGFKQAQLRRWIKSLNPQFISFNVGDRVHAQDTEGNWYPATILRAKDGQVYVTYEGWSADFDEWIPIPSSRIVPLSSTYKNAGIAALTSPAAAKKRRAGASSTNSAKRRRQEHSQIAHSLPKSASKSANKRTMKPTPKPKPKSAPQKRFENKDVCVVCGEPGSLLLCDGCPASYHGECFDPPLNIQQLPNDDWYCPDCEDDYKRIPVWIPKKTGVLRGERAPFKKDLAQWLMDHPGYQVWDGKRATGDDEDTESG